MSSVSGANAAGYRFNAAALFTKNDVLLSIVFIARRGDSHIAPSVRRCEELARQAKPPAPPSLQILGQQGRWGADGFVCRAAWKPMFHSFSALSLTGYVRIVAARDEDNGDWRPHNALSGKAKTRGRLHEITQPAEGGELRISGSGILS